MIGKKVKFSGSGPGGMAERKLAVESFQNIANVNISSTATERKKIDPTLASILALLGDSSMPVVEIGKKLPWDSDDLAKALAQGGENGMLTFSKDGDNLIVARK